MSEAIQLEWSSLEKLLPLCLEYVNKAHGKEEIDLHEAAAKFGKALGVEDIDKFAKGQFKGAIEAGLGQVFDSEDAAGVAQLFTKVCKPVMSSVVHFSQGEIDAKTFLAELNKSTFSITDELQTILGKAFGIPDEATDLLADKFGPYLVSIYCFAAAYKIYQSAARDAELAREHRIEIERLSNEAVKQLKAERAELGEMVDNYLLARLLPFDAGVKAMDEAILENDDDGFIRANAELWGLFGRSAQYSTAKEFDDLMLSDEAFRL